MANLFWVGGTGTWDGITNHFATTSGGSATVAATAAADVVTFDGSSGGGVVTLATAPSMTTLTMGAYTGSFVGGVHTMTVSGVFSISGSATRTMTLTNTTINCGTWTATTTTGLTFTPTSSTITMNGAGTTFNGGALTYATVNLTGSGVQSLAGANTFTTLTRTPTAVKTDSLSIGATQTVSGTLTLNANSITNRLLVTSGTVGTAMTLSAGTLVCTNVIDFQDITASGAATWTTGASGATAFGDCGGNTGITMTGATTQTWSGTSGGNWSANAWTTHVPYPQDTVVISSAFSASQTITNDMPRLGASINWTGATGAPTWAFSSTPNTIFGSVTLVNGVVISGTQTTAFQGRTTQTIKTANATWTQPIFVQPSTATLQLGDDFLSTNTFAVGSGFNEGGFNAQNHNQTCTTFTGGFGTGIDHGTGTLTLTSTAATTVYSQSPNFSQVTANLSTIVISGATANTRTFSGGGYTYGTLTYTQAGSTGILLISGSNTFSTWNFSDATNARNIRLTISTTQTIAAGSGLVISGTSGKLTTFDTTLAGTAATIQNPGGLVSVDFVSIKDNTASGDVPFYAGANSTNVSGNTNWTFTVPPAEMKQGNLMTMGVG